jgi:hypothetical protein
MDAREFVEALLGQAYQPAIVGAQSLLLNPPGRRPAPELVKLSTWYNGLPDSDRLAATGVAELAARLAIFGVLAILDGVRAVESSEEKGAFELRYKKGDEDALLNDPRAEQLHDLFRAALPPP